MKRHPLQNAVALVFLSGVPVLANEPPLVEFQPPQCSTVGKPIELCATVLDDGDIARVRTYFRRPGEKEYFISEMKFEGASFCTTLPGVKPKKLRSLEYYIQAFDTEFESRRTSTYQMQIQAEGECAFPAEQKDPEKAKEILVHATSKKQGNKVPDYLDPTGVTFVPLGGGKD